MKKLLYVAMGLAIVVASSCKKNSFSSIEKPLVPGVGAAPDTLIGDITTNTTLTKTTWLQGIVHVAAGVTLTVNAGVTVIGSPGGTVPDLVNLANNKGTLCIQTGAKLVANGTPTAPIVWTSSKPAGSRNFGDWGGVVLYGLAPIHTASGATTNLFEAFNAIPDTRNQYGGTNAADNSGSMTYNRFEFGGGVVLTANQEVNGFTFCGVGSGTVFNHNEVLMSGDDAVEFFGGTVNVDHLVLFGAKDDDDDFDEGYQGRQQFIIGYRTNNVDNSGSHNIEADNDASATNGTPTTSPFIANATFVGPGTAQNYAGAGSSYFDGCIFLRRNVRIKLVNSLIIAQQHPYALVTTPTTTPRVASTATNSDSIVIAFNIFQTNAAIPVTASSVEGNPVVPTGVDNVTINKLVGLGNSALGAFSDFQLDAFLTPQPGSPAASGGADLAALGLPFVGTTQRGAVITSDPWTSTGTWISIATN